MYKKKKKKVKNYNYLEIAKKKLFLTGLQLLETRNYFELA